MEFAASLVFVTLRALCLLVVHPLFVGAVGFGAGFALALFLL